MASDIWINYGGFVPLSTVDWRGRSVCVVFFRGCPVRCWYCQNSGILSGTDMRSLQEILSMIHSASLMISGVVFSGGEATMQRDALLHLAEEVKKTGLKTGLHTNGFFPDTVSELLEKRLLDHIALDIKAEWKLYTKRLNADCGMQVRRSLHLSTDAYHAGSLPSFEVVMTLFPGYGDEVVTIAGDVSPDVDLVLQQGVSGGMQPLQCMDMMDIAGKIGRNVRIRTREEGEIWYEGNRYRRDAGLRKR